VLVTREIHGRHFRGVDSSDLDWGCVLGKDGASKYYPFRFYKISMLSGLD
jgi:hypothetical protein